MKFEALAVIGLGYIGLPTAATFASRGLKVIGVDVNKKAVDTINQGKIHIIEPDLDIVVRSVVQSGNLRATTAAVEADAFIVAVPTPFKGNKQPDLSYIESASKAIAPVLKKGNLIILESTSPVGATEQMSAWLAEARPDLTFPQQAGEASDIRVAHCPERVLPGKVMIELVNNDRVIGGMTPLCSSVAADLYKLFVQGECIITNARTAEMCKLAENSFRDVNIAYANELSIICEKLKINVWELIRLANRHPRVNILQPGPGVGGHCIAVDPWFIVDSAPDDAHLIRAAREVNDHKPHWVMEKVMDAVKEVSVAKLIPEDKVSVACLGLSFKADIDDLRESPALEIACNLSITHAGKVYAVEPNISVLPQLSEGARLELIDLEAGLAADIILLLVDHKPFKAINPLSLKGKHVIDTRGAWAV